MLSSLIYTILSVTLYLHYCVDFIGLFEVCSVDDCQNEQVSVSLVGFYFKRF